MIHTEHSVKKNALRSKVDKRMHFSPSLLPTGGFHVENLTNGGNIAWHCAPIGPGLIMNASFHLVGKDSKHSFVVIAIHTWNRFCKSTKWGKKIETEVSSFKRSAVIASSISLCLCNVIYGVVQQPFIQIKDYWKLQNYTLLGYQCFFFSP